MKKFEFSLLLMLLPIMASAEIVERDGVWYNLIPKAKEAEVTKSPNSSDRYSGSIEIPPSVTYNKVEYSVTSIGLEAFRSCSGLTSVTIPNSVKSIGDRAFSGCSSLPSITIPKNVTSIGSFAFSYCSGLTSFTIPNNVTSIGESVFQNCNGLTSVIIPNSVESIGGASFRNCSSLTSVTIPNSVTSIGAAAFDGCSGLTSVTIGNSVSSIGISAFCDCCSLTSVTIPNSVTSIDYKAFSGCKLLTDVYCMPEQVCSYYGHQGLYTETDAFANSYQDYITLHVPAASVEVYRAIEPWSKFKGIVPIEDGDISVMPKCAAPEISYVNGKITFSSETEGVEYVSEIQDADIKKHYEGEITLTQKYKVSVYATKAGYQPSDVVKREIVITGPNEALVVGDVDGNGIVNVADHVELTKIIMGTE